MRSRLHAFTLIELLVVISIIALLIAILLPALNQARTDAQFMQCMTQLRSFSTASMTYSSDNKDLAVLPNWNPGSAGWLYAEEDPTNPGAFVAPGRYSNDFEKRRAMRETGWLWEYLGGEGGIYYCPVDQGRHEDSSKPIWAMTSYVANGALNGFGRRGMNQYKHSDFGPDAAIFWENDEKSENLGVWHDGANQPAPNNSAGLTKRHIDGAPVSLIDGSTTKWTQEDYIALARATTANALYCAPGRPNGR